MVDGVAAAHDAVAKGFCCHLGRLSHNGLPRLSRFRVGATRFSLTDGDGNAMIVIERGERDRQASNAWSDPALGAAERKLELARRLLGFKDDPASARHILIALEADLETPEELRRRVGVCQRSCPPISCGVSDFRGAGFVLGVEPDGSGGSPVAGFA